MSRIQLEDSAMSAIMKMVDGNPGAISVLVTLMKEEARIDPDSAFGGIGTLLALDTLGIYGSNIWILYKDVCKQNAVNMVLLFRANQLGFVTSKAIKDASNDQTRSSNFDFVDLMAKVKDRLPDFGG